MMEKVNLRPGTLPGDYVNVSKYSDRYAGELIRPDGSFYSRKERDKYYSPLEKDHPARTPLHVARWAIQEYTDEGDWVLDPTVGVGTTIVEALLQKRNAVGVEIQFIEALKASVEMNNPHGMKYRIVHDDARFIADHISDLRFKLVVNNPPYSGDESQRKFSTKTDGVWDDTCERYDKKYDNLAHLHEGKEYLTTMAEIYSACADRLVPGGHFIVAVKDMMRGKKPFLLHEMLGDILSRFLEYEKMVVLKHYPPTLHLNTYEKNHGVKPPLYQTILVFKKE
jgi:DNA modification methylase